MEAQLPPESDFRLMPLVIRPRMQKTGHTGRDDDDGIHV
jgi:hypothetical protein